MSGCEDCVEGSLRREEEHDAEIPSVPAGANASSLHSHEGFSSTNAKWFDLPNDQIGGLLFVSKSKGGGVCNLPRPAEPAHAPPPSTSNYLIRLVTPKGSLEGPLPQPSIVIELTL